MPAGGMPAGAMPARGNPDGGKLATCAPVLSWRKGSLSAICPAAFIRINGCFQITGLHLGQGIVILLLRIFHFRGRPFLRVNRLSGVKSAQHAGPCVLQPVGQAPDRVIEVAHAFERGIGLEAGIPVRPGGKEIRYRIDTRDEPGELIGEGSVCSNFHESGARCFEPGLYVRFISRQGRFLGRARGLRCRGKKRTESSRVAVTRGECRVKSGLRLRIHLRLIEFRPPRRSVAERGLRFGDFVVTDKGGRLFHLGDARTHGRDRERRETTGGRTASGGAANRRNAR